MESILALFICLQGGWWVVSWAEDSCYLYAHQGVLKGFRYTDHIFNYLIFLRSLDSGKLSAIAHPI